MNSEIKDMIDLVHQMNDYVQEQETELRASCFEKGFKFNILTEYQDFSKEQMEEWTSPILMAILDKYMYRHEDGTPYVVYPEAYDERVDKIRENILSLDTEARAFIDALARRDEVMKDAETAVADYNEYLSSHEVAEKNEAIVTKWKEKLEDPNTPLRDRMIISKNLKIRDRSNSMEFVFDRMSKLDKKEKDNLVDGFFNQKKSNYIMRKFYQKMHQLGFSDTLYKSMLDIEVNFLGEDYFKFNNLFLYNVVRFVGYADISNAEEATYAKSVMVKLSQLVFNRLSDNEKEEIISIIKKFDDFFVDDYSEIFVEKNETSPDSEFRQNLKKKKEGETIQNIKEWYDEHEEFTMPEEYASVDDLVETFKKAYEVDQLQSWMHLHGIRYDKMTDVDSQLESLRQLKDLATNPPTEEDEEVVEDAVDVCEETSDDVEELLIDELNEEQTDANDVEVAEV